MAQRTCSEEGCDRPHYGKGLCARDYQRQRKNGSTDAPSDIRKCGHERTPENTITEANGKKRCRPCREAWKASFISDEKCAECGEPVRAKGLCTTHYQRMKNKGSLEDPVRLTPDERVQHRRDAVAKHYRENREHYRATARERYQRNIEAERARNRRYNEANREKIAELNRRWREANPARMADLRKAWAQANPDRIRAIDMAKSAKRRMQIEATQIEEIDPRLIIAEHGMVCHICTERIPSWADLHFDHVIPLARGGSHTYDNIRPSHARCNQRKGAKLLP